MKSNKVGYTPGLEDLINWYARHTDGRIPSGALLKYEKMAEAAPELLEALELALMAIDDKWAPRVAKLARAAISKAKGDL